MNSRKYARAMNSDDFNAERTDHSDGDEPAFNIVIELNALELSEVGGGHGYDASSPTKH
jgi:hypothetical protein